MSVQPIKKMPSVDQRIKFRWIFATIIGSVLGIGMVITSAATALSENSFAIPIIALALSGAPLGISQWIVLRNHIRNAIWWILATVLGWLLGILITAVIFGVLSITLSNWFYFSLDESTIEKTINGFGANLGMVVILVVALVASIMGTITGLILGSAQSITVRRQVQKSGRWIKATIVGWASGSAIGIIAIITLLVIMNISSAVTLTKFLIFAISACLIYGIVNGLIVSSNTAQVLEKWLETSQPIKTSSFVRLALNHWTQLEILPKILSLIGIIGITISTGIAVYLISSEFGARILDHRSGFTSGGSCQHPEMIIEADKRTITEKESVIVSISLSDPSTDECEVTVELYSLDFDISSQKESQTVTLKRNETSTVIWVLRPREPGTYQVGISCEMELGSIGITVTNVLGLTAFQAQLFAYLGTFFSSSFTLPWLYTVWRERRKEKAEERKKRDEELEKLKRQVNDLRTSPKSKK